LDGLHLPVDHQAEGTVGEQSRRLLTVACGLGVTDGLDHLAIPPEPSGGPADAMISGAVRRNSN
jgi:hypothetical protein